MEAIIKNSEKKGSDDVIGNPIEKVWIVRGWDDDDDLEDVMVFVGKNEKTAEIIKANLKRNLSTEHIKIDLEEVRDEVS